jgi:8-oxo-dGTP pyrophosphatase MutT (NUDIX family)
MTYVVHPQKNDRGQQVRIHDPCQCSPVGAWGDDRSIATVTPGGPMPAELSGCGISSWVNVPNCADDWESLANTLSFTEPPFKLQLGKSPAAGTVIVEPDGRVWLMSPTNAFGGYKNTFPKGRVEKGLSMRATALKEAWEEAGLKVQLTGFLCDTPRHTTLTRYYTALRVAGSPSDMGWESQAVHLVPVSRLVEFVDHPNDRPLVTAVKSLLSAA